MKQNIETDVHYGVGPYVDMYGHGPVTVFNRPETRPETGETRQVAQFFVCLDCGYVAPDNRLFLHEECDPDDNPITKSWRRHIEEDGFPSND